MGYSDFGEIEVKQVLGLEVEKEDREVGIFGNDFCLVIGDNKEHPHHLYFDDDSFEGLLEKLRPYFEEKKAREDWELKNKHNKGV